MGTAQTKAELFTEITEEMGVDPLETPFGITGHPGRRVWALELVADGTLELVQPHPLRVRPITKAEYDDRFPEG